MDVAFLAPVSPFGPNDGHRLAVLSDIYAAVDNRLDVGAISFAYGKERETIPPICAHTIVHTRPGGFVRRLYRGLANGLAPSLERLYSNQSYEEIRTTFLKWRPTVLVIDDASVSGYVPLIRETLPNTKIVLRSHNVMHDVRLAQLARTGGPKRPIVKLDCERYLSFERQAVEACDAHWAISTADAARMTHLYGVPTQCLSVSLPLEKYESLGVDRETSNRFVHVGTLDFRRRWDLKQFLDTRWPKVLSTDSNATLTLAGKLHGKPIPARNVVYCRSVADDADIYRLGRFAVNFQLSTGGIKLKTLTSLAAGRTLISTLEGAEGLSIESGDHYLEIDSFISNPLLKELLGDIRATEPIADAGRQYVRSNHSRTVIARHFEQLLAGI